MTKRVLAALFLLLLIGGYYWTSPAHSFSDSSVTLHANQLNEDLAGGYLNAINSAEKSVLVMVYSINDSKIIQALNRKQASGVPVKVITDAKASRSLRKKLNSDIDLHQRFFKGLMHLKIVVIDEKEVWLGSANLTTESLKRQPNLVLNVVHPDLAAMVAQKALNLQGNFRRGRLSKRKFTVPGQELELSFFPDEKEGAEQLKQMIRSAKKTVRIAMYTWTRMDLAEEVVAAKERGVDVQVALDRGASLGSSRKIYDFLQKNAINVTRSKGKALFHHKFLCVDDAVLVFGSANWTKAAFKTNDDCFAVIKPLTEEQVKKVQAVWQAGF